MSNKVLHSSIIGIIVFSGIKNLEKLIIGIKIWHHVCDDYPYDGLVSAT